MPRRFHLPWLPRLLFLVSMTLSVVLIVLVLLAPLVDNGVVVPPGWQILVAVFAEDVTLRRTAVAGALGLAVSACIFFRAPGRLPAPRGGEPARGRSRRHTGRLPPPPTIAGA